MLDRPDIKNCRKVKSKKERIRELREKYELFRDIIENGDWSIDGGVFQCTVTFYRNNRLFEITKYGTIVAAVYNAVYEDLVSYSKYGVTVTKTAVAQESLNEKSVDEFPETLSPSPREPSGRSLQKCGKTDQQVGRSA